MAKKQLHVVAGILLNSDRQVLIAKRPEGKSHAGYWEFPGGKREAGESAVQSLRRELSEEVDVTVRSAAPLVAGHYDYSSYGVHLQTWLVHDFVGDPQPLEGQELKWVEIASLADYTMPEANAFVADALQEHFAAVAV